tara:strand:+ start:242 stop:445 length:204 start_codon:yes stop_codon:yes gene_type:complete
MSTGTYIGTAKVVEDDDGEMLLEFDVETLNQMGWDEETMLEWIIDEEEVTLREAKNGRDKTESISKG